MRQTQRGADLLLQIRTQTLNGGPASYIPALVLSHDAEETEEATGSRARDGCWLGRVAKSLVCCYLYLQTFSTVTDIY